MKDNLISDQNPFHVLKETFPLTEKPQKRNYHFKKKIGKQIFKKKKDLISEKKTQHFSSKKNLFPKIPWFKTYLQKKQPGNRSKKLGNSSAARLEKEQVPEGALQVVDVTELPLSPRTLDENDRLLTTNRRLHRGKNGTKKDRLKCNHGCDSQMT